MSLSSKEQKELLIQFQKIDTSRDGKLDANEVMEVFKLVGMDINMDQVKEEIRKIDLDGNGQVDFNEFVTMYSKMKSGEMSSASGFQKAAKEHKNMIQVKGASGHHTFAEEEMAAFAEHINNCLGDDPELAYLMPINPEGMDLCDKVKDGVLLAKFINCAEAGTIDERVLNKRKGNKDLSLFQINENLTLVIASATSIGISTVNVGANEMIKGREHPHIILGLIWQLVKHQLLASIDLKNHPELIRLLEEGEELSDLLALPPDQILLRWFNYHLKNAGWARRVKNFGGDIKDGENYTVLLNQIAPDTCSRNALQEPDLTNRAGMVLDDAKRLGVNSFLQPRDIVSGNSKLNLAFTAAIFNQCPGLEDLTQEELEKAGLMDDDFGDSREERAFRMWINSLGIDGVYINSLFEDLRDGLALLRVIDYVEPGIVHWPSVEMKVNNKFKKVANCNYAVVLGKQMKFSLVGIGGTDICDGNRKLILAFIWQLMRYHTLKFLANVGGGSRISEDTLIQWANDKVSASGASSRMASFRDPSLSSGVFFLDLLSAVESRIIDQSFVTEGKTEEDALLNAKYAVSIARKLGATIFLLPEDIVEVKPKMILTFVASIMSVATQR